MTPLAALLMRCEASFIKDEYHIQILQMEMEKETT